MYYAISIDLCLINGAVITIAKSNVLKKEVIIGKKHLVRFLPAQQDFL